MERPDLPIVNQIVEAVAALREAEQEVKKRGQELRVLATQVGDQRISASEIQDAIDYIYWHIDDVPVSYLADGLGVHVNKLKRRLCSVTTNVFCRECRKPIVFTSRTDLKEALKKSGGKASYSKLCPKCERARRIESDRINHAEREREGARKVELRTMPYSLYLLTPEWQQRREVQVRSAKYSCQVCNKSNTPLNVHHRTYERRGAETFKDLIVLCRGCHDLFHREGKLAK